MKDKTIGLIGGMGPFSSSYFYKLLLKKSSDSYGAKNNDDFPEILIDSVPVTDFISDTSKLREAKNILISRIKKMNIYGVGSIAMVCNTGHVLYEDLSRISKAQFESMIELVARETFKKGYKRVGVLATPTTIKYDLYGKSLSKNGVEAFYPDIKTQKLHELIIRDMVAGKKSANIRKFERFTKDFIKKNKLDCVVLGCTELPLVFPKNKFVNVIDCMDVLADELLKKYYNY